MPRAPLQFAVERITAVARLAAPRTLLSGLRQRFARSGLTRAVACHDTPALFDWLMPVLSYQGVSDAIAWAYMDQHGTVAHADLTAGIAAAPACSKLRSYWDLAECRFAKHAFTCSEPGHIARCPLPRHDLRNGRLNQTAYSLFLFFRDVCADNVVSWLDQRLAAADQGSGTARAASMRAAILEPLTNIYGVSSKVLSMALADLLLAGDPARERWVATGASLIAIDTLVHNWLHRSGCLAALGAEHAYGPRCYAARGCAELIEAVSAHVDARQFCPDGPACFPRLLQKAIWRFCAAGELDVCNGNRIDDRHRCAHAECQLHTGCARLALRSRSTA